MRKSFTRLFVFFIFVAVASLVATSSSPPANTMSDGTTTVIKACDGTSVDLIVTTSSHMEQVNNALVGLEGKNQLALKAKTTEKETPKIRTTKMAIKVQSVMTKEDYFTKRELALMGDAEVSFSQTRCLHVMMVKNCVANEMNSSNNLLLNDVNTFMVNAQIVT